MRAFDRIFELLTGSQCKNGHAISNIKNRYSLEKANKEIEEMLKAIK